MRFLIISLLAVFASGCACKSINEPPLVMRQKDRALSCRQLDYEISETDVKLTYTKEQKSNSDLYVDYPVCIVKTYSQNSQSEIALRTRLEYLFQLYDLKGCNSKQSLPQKINQDKANRVSLPNS